jgi:multiple sugar transport system ATP-binding protein
MAELKLTDVAKSYGDVHVLKNIDLDIKTGELIVFVGPSGCGKSTLLRMIAGLEKISGGTLEIDGTVVNDVPPSQRGIAMVFQSYALYPHMTVRDNMAFALKIAKKSKDEIDAAIAKASRILQLEPYLDRLPKALSGGQRQRVAIGRSIVRDPTVYLFDEPLSNLDAALRVATRIEIAQLKETMPDSTMIYVTHDQVEAMTLADRIVVLNDCRIEQVGTPMEVYTRPASRFVAGFVGSPAMNILKVTLSGSGDRLQARLADGSLVPVTGVSAPAGSPELGVRPEALIVVAEGGETEGTATVVERLGERTLVHVRLKDGAQVTAQDRGISTIQPGETVRLKFDTSALHLFGEDGRAWHSA